MHSLQCKKEISWDDKLSDSHLREWKNICRQINNIPEISINRFVGRKQDPFKLVAFCDASKHIYGVVLYIVNLKTKEVHFLLSKNRIIGRQLELKSIPSLEFQAISLGTETIIDTYNELSGSESLDPINIQKLEVFSDSVVALSWLNSRTNKFDKQRKRSVFVRNRLSHIEHLCDKFPVTFKFCAGMNNPADCTTRSLSYKCLMTSNFFTGPETVQGGIAGLNDFDITIPHPLTKVFQVPDTQCEAVSATESEESDFIVSAALGSSLLRLASVYKSVLTFINNIKQKLKHKRGKYDHFTILSSEEISVKALHLVILHDQKKQFADVFRYFHIKNPVTKDMPNLVSQFNLFVDKFGLLRVKSKFHNWKDRKREFPILLDKKSRLTEELILEFHKKLAHSGIYSTLSELRKEFWVLCSFSTVKKALKTCVHCRRFNGRTIKLNQSPYRGFRISPPTVPYRYIFIDYFGPYWIRWQGKKSKVWILAITCLWSRAINLKVCLDLSVKSFLRVFQLHCYEFGVPELCLSDQGSQLTAGAKIIENFLNDMDTKSYFIENSVKPLSFQQYYKGHNELGL